MAIFKCKMCGGALEVLENQSIATCEYCGTQQTLPKIDDEKKIGLFNRANNLRLKSEFDKASGIYESIIAEFPGEAEAYWGLVLCKYGIEYVDDKDGSKIPTCHRTLPTSIMKDEDFQQACENADILAKNIYRDEAKVIDCIQKKILEIAATEEPYDIFICYKETDEITGARTEDSSIAQDIYTALTEMGYKVFYARNSLRKVAGTEYEPYIYAALSSAKIMLAIGTKFNYYDAVWVKNEWSRFISMIANNPSKVLIPCYKNMDAYDIPEEFSNMQALDMGDVTFFGSLTENIERIIDKARGKTTKETIVFNNDNVDVAPLLERGFLYLEDKEWGRADEFFEAVLNKDPKNAKAYLGKLLVDLKVSRLGELSDFYATFSDNNSYEKIMRFGDEKLKESVKICNDIIVRRNEEARKKALYKNALEIMKNATTEEMFENAGYMFIEVKDYEDAKEKSEECFEKAEIARIECERQAEIACQKAEVERKDDLYNKATKLFSANRFNEAIEIFESLGDWRDSKQRIKETEAKIEEKNKQAELARKKEEIKAKRRKMIAVTITSIIAIVVVFAIVLTTFIIPGNKYNDAVTLMNNGEYKEALSLFSSLNEFKNSNIYISEILNKIVVKETISASVSHTVGLKSDGTIVAAGANYASQCDVEEWTDIVAISAGDGYTVGLKSDGTVVAIGFYVEDWIDIVAISTFDSHLVGLKSDGTVVTAGTGYAGEGDVSEWTGIVAISAGGDHTVGLKSDGTVVATGRNDCGECDVEEWTDIAAISAGDGYTVGLKSDGTVVATGDWIFGWTDIVAVSAGGSHTVALKSDGTVVASGKNNDYGQCDVEEWTDIVAISAGYYHTVGLKSDGTVVSVGRNSDGQLDVSDWTDIKLPE